MGDWIKTEKIRGVWSFPPGDPFETAPKLRDASINMVMPRIEIAVSEEQEKSVEHLRKAREFLLTASRACRQSGLKMFYCLDTGADGAVVGAGFKDNERRFHRWGLPCPLDDAYWERVVTGRFKRAIALLPNTGEFQLDALTIDPEMYSLNGMKITAPCYCRHCLLEYAAAKGIRLPASVAEAESFEVRREWLKESALDADYEEYQYERILERTRAMRSELESLRPGLLYGFLLYRGGLFDRALAAGLDWPDRPVLLFPESTYSGECNAQFFGIVDWIHEDCPVKCLVVPGLSLGLEGPKRDKVPEEFLKVVPGNLYRRCISDRVSGYWVWAAYRFGPAPVQDRFLATLAQADVELDRYIASGGSYESPLKAAPVPLCRPANLDDVIVGSRSWEQPAKGAVPARHPGVKPPGFRGTALIVLQARAGEEIAFRFQPIRLGSYTSDGVYRLFDPGGLECLTGRVELGKPVVIRHKADKDGRYCLVATAGSNRYHLEPLSSPASMAGVPGICKRGGVLYFLVPEGVAEFQVELSASLAEHAGFRIVNPNGEAVVEHLKLTKPRSVRVPVGDQAGRIWWIEIVDPVEDCGFRLKGIPEILSFDPAALITAPKK